MRIMYRSGSFSPIMKRGMSLNLLKRYFITILLIVIAVIYLARNMSNSPRPQINYWEYYQQGFEQSR